MTANLTATVAHSSRPCACGGAATSGAAGCTCGGAEYGICQSQGFMRPRFFAGQLLTEDDLQQLGDYVVTKNRLHNRFLFGEGVVCGLEVTCHPCGDGQVIVHPGYALDCCGNDVTLACAQTLDINAMVAELRRKLLGFDCGDPCADKDATGKPVNATKGTAQEQREDIARHYCLYVRYCEELTDPVAPYSTGEPCGAQVCEPTRVREGLQFELRCREADKPYEGLFTRIGECLGDLPSTEKSVRDVRYFQVFARQTQMAVTAMRANPVPSEPNMHDVANATERLQAALQVWQQPSRRSDETLRVVLDAGTDTASLVARFDLRTMGDQGTSTESPTGLGINEARGSLVEMQRLVTQDLINSIFTLLLERVSAIALIEISAKLTGRSFSVDDLEVRFLAERAILTSAVLRASATSLDALREWLLDRLDHAPYLTDCSLRQAVRQVMPPTPPPQVQLSLSDATVYTRAAASLANIFIRYLTDCLCLALNPACTPCDDPAVLLACLEVKDCEVVRICNLERTFVLSPTAVRYWVPFGLLGQLIERVCCPVAKCPEDHQASFVSSTAPALFDPLREQPPLPSPLGEVLSLLSAGLSEVGRKDGELLRRIVFAAALSLGQNYADRSPDLLQPFRAFSMLHTSPLETEEQA